MTQTHKIKRAIKQLLFISILVAVAGFSPSFFTISMADASEGAAVVEQRTIENTHNEEHESKDQKEDTDEKDAKKDGTPSCH